MRIVHLFSRISDIDEFEIENILRERRSNISIVEADVPMCGWVTPIGIVLNLSSMTILQKNHVFVLSVLIGHELAHCSSRKSTSFEFSPPEKVQSNPDSEIHSLQARSISSERIKTLIIRE
jgi:hypothetical protein